MRLLPLILMAGFVAWSQTAAAQSNNGITVINNPGGGTIAYAQMPAQHTLQVRWAKCCSTPIAASGRARKSPASCAVRTAIRWP